MLAAAVAAACGGGATGAKAPKAATRAALAPGDGCKAASAAEPLSKAAESATLALAKVKGKRVAFVADEDSKAILTIDLDSRAELASTALDGTPSQVWVSPDGRVFVTLRDRNELAAFSASSEGAPLTKLCAAPTPDEPVALAETPDHSTLVVTAGWGRRLAAFDAATLTSKFEAKVSREPRAVVVSDDGKTAFVSHAVGSVVSAVDLAGDGHEVAAISTKSTDIGRVEAVKRQKNFIKRLQKTDPARASQMAAQLALGEEDDRSSHPSCQGFALAKSSEVPGRIFAPMALVDPGDLERRPGGYGDENSQTEQPAVAVIDEGARTALAPSVAFSRDVASIRKGLSAGPSDDHNNECLLPRSAAIDPKTKSLLVTCYGIDAVVAYDATAANPLRAERRRWVVGAGPSGVAVDPERHRAFVWSQFDRTFSTFSLGGVDPVDEKAAPHPVQKTALSPGKALPPDYVLGRILFHAAGDPRVAADGRACASCHPDGRDDAITWATPDGPRRSITLAGRAASTPPYSWNGSENSLHNHLGNTFERLNGGGLRSVELDALVAYISRMPAPPRGAAEAGAKIERGRAIFTSAEAGCSSCHAGGSFTDGKNHDVGSKHKADRAAEFNTPSLHLVGGGGPYFHDGRYATLAELLKKSDGQMGRTAHLSDADLEALEAYLKTL